MIIYGWKTRKKEWGNTITPYQCTHCQNANHFLKLSLQEWFTLFFLPIFPIGRKKKHMVCPVCQAAYNLPENEPLKIEK